MHNLKFCFLISPSVKKLSKKLPDVLSKIESINQQLLPLGNISDNVDRIRELIQQARDAANKVGVTPCCHSHVVIAKTTSYLIHGKLVLFPRPDFLVVWNMKADFFLLLYESAHDFQSMNFPAYPGPDAVSSHWVYAGGKRVPLLKLMLQAPVRDLWAVCQQDFAQDLLSYILKVIESILVEDGGCKISAAFFHQRANSSGFLIFTWHCLFVFLTLFSSDMFWFKIMYSGSPSFMEDTCLKHQTILNHT